MKNGKEEYVRGTFFDTKNDICVPRYSYERLNGFEGTIFDIDLCKQIEGIISSSNDSSKQKFNLCYQEDHSVFSSSARQLGKAMNEYRPDSLASRYPGPMPSVETIIGFVSHDRPILASSLIRRKCEQNSVVRDILKKRQGVGKEQKKQ